MIPNYEKSVRGKTPCIYVHLLCRPCTQFSIYSTRYTHVWYTVQCNTPYGVLGTWYNIPSIFFLLNNAQEIKNVLILKEK